MKEPRTSEGNGYILTVTKEVAVGDIRTGGSIPLPSALANVAAKDLANDGVADQGPPHVYRIDIPDGGSMTLRITMEAYGDYSNVAAS